MNSPTETEILLSKIEDLRERKEELGETAYIAELEKLAQELSDNYRDSLDLKPGEGYAALENAKELLRKRSPI